MPQASAKSNTVQSGKSNEPIFTPRFIAGFAVNFILYMQYYALMVAMAGYSAMQFAAGATEGGFTASVFILGALCSRLFFGGAIDKVGRGRVLVACMTGEVACTLLYLAFEHVPAIGVFIVLRFLHGAFYGLSQTTVTSIVSSAVPFSRKGEGVGYYMLSVTLGAALGPPDGLGILERGRLRYALYRVLGHDRRRVYRGAWGCFSWSQATCGSGQGCWGDECGQWREWDRSSWRRRKGWGGRERQQCRQAREKA